MIPQESKGAPKRIADYARQNHQTDGAYRLECLDTVNGRYEVEPKDEVYHPLRSTARY
jgi:hypothetical protein